MIGADTSVDLDDFMATTLLHLADRRGVTTIADVLDRLGRNQVLTGFTATARDRLLKRASTARHGKTRAA